METTFVLLEESWIQLRSFPVYDSCCISFRRHLLAERTENVSHLFSLVGFWWGASICQLCILMLSLNPNQKINKKTGGHTPTLYPLNAYDIFLSFSSSFFAVYFGNEMEVCFVSSKRQCAGFVQHTWINVSCCHILGHKQLFNSSSPCCHWAHRCVSGEIRRNVLFKGLFICTGKIFL